MLQNRMSFRGFFDSRTPRDEDTFRRAIRAAFDLLFYGLRAAIIMPVTREMRRL